MALYNGGFLEKKPIFENCFLCSRICVWRTCIAGTEFLNFITEKRFLALESVSELFMGHGANMLHFWKLVAIWGHKSLTSFCLASGGKLKYRKDLNEISIRNFGRNFLAKIIFPWRFIWDPQNHCYFMSLRKLQQNASFRDMSAI